MDRFPLWQKTLAAAVTVSGHGLHSGLPMSATLNPAPAGTGIVFVRTDLAPAVEMPVAPEKVTETMMATTLAQDGCKLATVEHLMSALHGLGVDNVRIEVSGPEVPIMDGSALPFVRLIESVGLVRQDAPRTYLRVTAPVEVREAGKFARLEPWDGFAVDFSIDFDNPAIQRTSQRAVLDFSRDAYRDTVAYARTFGFYKDVQMLRSMHLGLGGSLENAVVVDGEKILNPEGLRAGDEFVKHKVLDAMGDLYVCGLPLLARYVAFKSGHGLNNRLIRQLNDRNCEKVRLV